MTTTPEQDAAAKVHQAARLQLNAAGAAYIDATGMGIPSKVEAARLALESARRDMDEASQAFHATFA